MNISMIILRKTVIIIIVILDINVHTISIIIAIHYSLLTTHYSLLTTYYWLLTTDY